MSELLVIQFDGWCLMRIPTDPDPTDETRGVSGYTFAFADEPDLDRILYFQNPQGMKTRTFGPEIGVSVRSEIRTLGDGKTKHEIPELVGATVDLLDQPMLQNRNWVLTMPGYEPIVPFNLRIQGDGISIRRNAPLDVAEPDKPVWKVDQADLLAQGATGLSCESATVGEGSGIWNSFAIAQERCGTLQKELKRLQQEGGHEANISILESRIIQLQIGLPDPTDRRILARYIVERFGFPVNGQDIEIDGPQQKILGGILSHGAKPPDQWQIGFWIYHTGIRHSFRQSRRGDDHARERKGRQGQQGEKL